LRLPLRTAATTSFSFCTASATASGSGPLFPIQVVQP
jgi:hypothetical protein